MTQAQTAKHPVLIVGGGPSGIVAAIELARRGVPFRLIDRKKSPNLASRAFTIHAKTLEIFESWGIVDHYINTGVKSYGFVFNFEGLEEKPVLDFRILRSRYPFIVVYSQADTERVMREHLESSYDSKVEWGTQLVKLDQQKDGLVKAVLKNVDTEEEEDITASYVIGADGVHSFVRKTFNLPFEGEAYEGMIMQMMDTEVEGYDQDPEWTQYFMEKDNFLLTTPLPDNKYRLLVSDMGESADRKKESRVEAFQRILDQHNVEGSVGEPDWTTQWVIWKRLAEVYRHDTIFLSGDAAHVHSPSGGQGMNSCIQDSWNLAWKIAMVWKGHAKPSLLDTYEIERKPVGQQIIDGTDHMHEIIMAHGRGMEDRMALTQSPNWQREVTERVAGVSYTYFDLNPLPKGLKDIEGGPRIGDRGPDVDLPQRRTLFGHIRRPNMTLILMPNDEFDQAETLFKKINQDYGHVVSTKVVNAEPSEHVTSEDILEDPENALGEVYGTGKEGRLYLFRPDGYVGFKCDLSQADKLLEFLDGWFETAQKLQSAA